jgi:hypothetical protein
VRDESGRFVLAFLSDRDPRHRNLPYLCWSRDFVHWSNPALVLDETVTYLYGLVQDNRGRLILDYGAKDRRLLISADGIQWKSEKMPGSVLAQDRTGLFCTYKLTSTRKESAEEAAPRTWARTCYRVSRRTSGDLSRWGSQYWWANTSAYYRNLMPAGRLDIGSPETYREADEALRSSQPKE